MPTCKSFQSTANTKKTGTDISAGDVLAQVKLSREQAYFNSYDFDAIEVLPYNNEDDKASSSPSYCSSRTSINKTGSGFKKFGCMQRLGSVFGLKANVADEGAAAAAMTWSSTTGGVGDDPRQDHSVPNNDNFLLPRAVLNTASYQRIEGNVATSTSFAASLLAMNGIESGQTTDSSVTAPNLIKPVIELTRSKKRSIASSAKSTHTTDSGLGNTNFATTSSVAGTATNQKAATSARGGTGSHFSTDKSGSSGYYSSHVCSTYSQEEHIYCEPVIDILDSIEKDKSITVSRLRPQLHMPTNIAGNMSAANTVGSSQHLTKQHVQAKQTGAVQANAAPETDRQLTNCCQKKSQAKQQFLQPHYSEKLRNLETSIENLDRHLKTFQRFYVPLQTVSFVQQDIVKPTTDRVNLEVGEKMRNQLPTIMEGFAATQRQQPELDVDDSLQDIDLDAFLLQPRQKQKGRQQNLQFVGGIDNLRFLSDDQLEENNYKCAKYINSCPEDAYRVDNEVSLAAAPSNMANAVNTNSFYAKRYEDQLHFQSTRELLEDVRDKIRLLSPTPTTDMPQELDGMIQTLKDELETYLQRMIQDSELELRQLCNGLGKQQHVMRLQNAIERRRSFAGDLQLNGCYESVCEEGVLRSLSGRPSTVRTHIMSIRCASDPNFKMKRKSIAEIFPATDCHIDTTALSRSATPTTTPSKTPIELKTSAMVTQMQRNLTFHKPLLSGEGSRFRLSNGTNKTESIAEWHQKKPSIWEMYYGTNRLQQSLLGKQRHGGELVITSAHPTLSYPSSRPESDFTLDLPRAEQLRLKMEKEKRFRQRCRFITTFLSLVFFLLTVIVVSLVLTRGKRMFGSMI